MSLFKNNKKSTQKISSRLISVQKCFILPDFNEELPLYLLQLEDKSMLVIFGQWLYDPHILIAPEEIFRQWVESETFFSDFLLKYDAETGKVFELRVESSSFVPAEQLSEPLRFTHLRECEFIKGTGNDLIHDLKNSGLVKLDFTK